MLNYFSLDPYIFCLTLISFSFCILDSGNNLSTVMCVLEILSVSMTCIVYAVFAVDLSKA